MVVTGSNELEANAQEQDLHEAGEKLQAFEGSTKAKEGLDGQTAGKRF